MERILHQLIGSSYSSSYYLQGFVHHRWLAGFLPSTEFLSFLEVISPIFVGFRIPSGPAETPLTEKMDDIP